MIYNAIIYKKNNWNKIIYNTVGIALVIYNVP